MELPICFPQMACVMLSCKVCLSFIDFIIIDDFTILALENTALTTAIIMATVAAIYTTDEVTFLTNSNS